MNKVSYVFKLYLNFSDDIKQKKTLFALGLLVGAKNHGPLKKGLRYFKRYTSERGTLE